LHLSNAGEQSDLGNDIAEPDTECREARPMALLGFEENNKGAAPCSTACMPSALFVLRVGIDRESCGTYPDVRHGWWLGQDDQIPSSKPGCARS